MRPTTLFPLLLLAGCGLPGFGPDDDWERVVGRIGPELSSIQMLAMPATATAGEPFTITITTLGSGSCTRPAGATVQVSGLTADVTPYDLDYRGATFGCTDDLHPFPRQATITFGSTGTARLRLHGRHFSGDGDPVLYEIEVPVRGKG